MQGTGRECQVKCCVFMASLLFADQNLLAPNVRSSVAGQSMWGQGSQGRPGNGKGSHCHVLCAHGITAVCRPESPGAQRTFMCGRAVHVGASRSKGMHCLILCAHGNAAVLQTRTCLHRMHVGVRQGSASRGRADRGSALPGGCSFTLTLVWPHCRPLILFLCPHCFCHLAPLLPLAVSDCAPQTALPPTPAFPADSSSGPLPLCPHHFRLSTHITFAPLPLCSHCYCPTAPQPLPLQQLSAAAEFFGFDDTEKDEMLGGYIGAAFFAVGAPAALLVMLGVGWGKAGVTWQCQ